MHNCVENSLVPEQKIIQKKLSNHKYYVTILIVSIILSAFSSQVFSQDKIYSFGVVPQFEARKLRSIWNPILEHLQQTTGYQFKLVIAPSISDFEKAFMNGDYGFAYLNPYHYILASRLQGYLPLVRDVGKKLYGVLVVKKDSGINHVLDLDGKIIAFPSPNALGAALQMRQELKDDFNINIQAHYVKTHDSVYLNVILGEATAGGGVQKTLNRQSKKYQDMLKIIHTTRAVVAHPIVANPLIPKVVIDKVQQVFLNMGKTQISADLLKKIPIKTVGIAMHEDYFPLNSMDLGRFYVFPK